MGVQNEHGGIFKLDSTSGGSLVDYSAYVTDLTPPDMRGTVASYFVINDNNEYTSEGGAASSFSMTVLRDPAAASLHSILTTWSKASGGTGGLRTFQIDMPDSSAGSERFTGECRLENYTPGRVAGGSAEASKGQATFRVDNGFTHSVIS